MGAMVQSLRRAFVFALSSFVVATLLVNPARAHGGDHADDSEGDAPVNLRARGLILVKVYCLIIIFFATFIPGVSPYYMRWNNTFLVLGIQFAAGVFLATAMLHFLGDSNETFEDLTTKGYPFAMMLAVSGYLLTMFADLIVQYVYSRQLIDSHTSDVENNTRTDEKYQANGENKSCCGNAGECQCSNGPESIPEVRNLVKVTLIHKASFGDSLLLIFALCFHSVFEGLAIGVAASKYDAWKNLWTISLHKVFAAIAMGIALLRMMPDRPLLSCAAYAFAFAISSPIGVAIGIAIDASTQGPTADWIYAIAMGLATGIFIYVAINHLISDKAFKPDCKLRFDKPIYKFLAVTLGAGVIFIVMIWDT